MKPTIAERKTMQTLILCIFTVWILLGIAPIASAAPSPSSVTVVNTTPIPVTVSDITKKARQLAAPASRTIAPNTAIFAVEPLDVSMCQNIRFTLVGITTSSPVASVVCEFVDNSVLPGLYVPVARAATGEVYSSSLTMLLATPGSSSIGVVCQNRDSSDSVDIYFHLYCW